ncbi:MAG: hypothetical protein OXL96_00505 [Candidatus Poribacteria bacterium]|nr:hypothetical protein [Candidatus Poribacteria bacterium]
MITEDEKQQIADSITRAFDKHAHRQYRNLFVGIAEKKGGMSETIIEDRFLTIRASSIDSYMRVLEMRAGSKLVMKRRPILTRAAILSLAKGDFALSELDCDTDRFRNDGDSRRGYTDRQQRRLLRETHRDMFFDPEPDPARKQGDRRERRIASVFSDGGPPRDPAGDRAREFLDDAAKILPAVAGAGKMRRVALNSILRLAFPKYLKGVMAFRDECRAVFESLGQSSDRIDFLREQLVESPLLLDVVYSHLTSILDLAWFRTLKNAEKEMLLKPAPQAKYGPDDARKARGMLVDIYGPDLTHHFLDVSGTAFLQYDRPSAAAHVFMECSGMAQNDMSRGSAWQNVAVCHRMKKNFKLALGALRKALACFEAAGDTYRVCNALQLIGESQWRLGFRDAAMRSFDEVERRGMEMEAETRWLSQYILGMSFGRLGEMGLRRAHLVKALKMIPEEDTGTIIWVNDLIDYEHPISPDAVLPRGLGEELDGAVSRLWKTLYERGERAS